MTERFSKNSESEEKEISIGEILIVFLRNKKLFALSSAIVFVISIFYFLFFITPVYNVYSSMEIVSPEPSTGLHSPLTMVMGMGKSQGRSIEYEVFGSRRLRDAVIEKNNLFMKIERKNNNVFNHVMRVLFGTPSGNGFLLFNSVPDELKYCEGEIIAQKLTYTISCDGNTATCKWDEDCSLEKELFSISKVGGFDVPETFRFESQNIIDTRKFFSDNLNVQMREESGMLILNFAHESPFMAAQIVNDLIGEYIDLKEKWSQEDSQSKTSYVAGILDDLIADLDEKSDLLIQFQEKEKALVPEVQISELLRKHSSLRQEMEDVRLKRDVISGIIESIQISPDTPVVVPALPGDLAAQDTLKHHNNLIFKKNDLSQKLTHDHPAMIAVKKEISSSADLLKRMLQDNISQFDRTIRNIGSLLSEVDMEQKKAPELFFTFSKLKRDVEISEKMILALSSKLYETAIDARFGLPPVRVIDVPDAHVLRSSPQIKFTGFMIIFLSLFLGITVVFSKEFFMVMLKSYKDATRIGKSKV